jgi:hypothetical protein
MTDIEMELNRLYEAFNQLRTEVRNAVPGQLVGGDGWRGRAVPSLASYSDHLTSDAVLSSGNSPVTIAEIADLPAGKYLVTCQAALIEAASSAAAAFCDLWLKINGTTGTVVSYVYVSLAADEGKPASIPGILVNLSEDDDLTFYASIGASGEIGINGDADDMLSYMTAVRLGDAS